MVVYMSHKMNSCMYGLVLLEHAFTFFVWILIIMVLGSCHFSGLSFSLNSLHIMLKGGLQKYIPFRDDF